MPTFAETLTKTALEVQGIQSGILREVFRSTIIPNIDSSLMEAAKNGLREYKVSSLASTYYSFIKEYYESPLVGVKVSLVPDGVILSW